MIEVMAKRRAGAVLWGLALCFGLAAAGPTAAQDVSREVEERSHGLDVPFIPSHPAVLETMFDLAKVTGDDFVIDLGSGDGRIVITAAKRFGARGFGVDLNEELVAHANKWAREEGLADRVRFHVRDLFLTDISQATVVTMYLLPGVVLRLRPKLLADLAPGTRIVSHDYDLGAWRPEESRAVDDGWIARSVVHLYIVPARVAGRWAWRLPSAAGAGPETAVEAIVHQRFQRVVGKLREGGAELPVRDVRLRGRNLRFTVRRAGYRALRHHYQGTVEGDEIAGAVRTVLGGREVTTPWRARRLPAAGPGRR